MKIFLTGTTGQDGAILAEMLINRGDQVHGMVRRSSSFNRERIEHLIKQHKGKQLFLHYGDLTDGSNISRLIENIQPDWVISMGAQSHVKISFDVPEYSAQVDGIGVLRLLDAIRAVKPNIRFLQASTSEMFGNAKESPQNEKTPLTPASPYGAAKVFGYHIVCNYREAYNLFACNSICFNHEGKTRSENFVTRKITQSAARIANGLQTKVSLGNLASKRDWSDARDVCRGMIMMLEHHKPDDFVFASGEQHSVEEFCKIAFKHAGFDLTFEGIGEDRKGIDQNNIIRVDVDPKYYRPVDIDSLLGDASKAKKILSWTPKISFEKLVEEMTEHDLYKAAQEKYAKIP